MMLSLKNKNNILPSKKHDIVKNKFVKAISCNDSNTKCNYYLCMSHKSFCCSIRNGSSAKLVWVPKGTKTNKNGPKKIWVPKSISWVFMCRDKDARTWEVHWITHLCGKMVKMVTLWVCVYLAFYMQIG